MDTAIAVLIIVVVFCFEPIMAWIEKRFC